MSSQHSAAPVEVLVVNHRSFLEYLTGRAGDRDLGEDILRREQAPAEGAIVPGFYRVLRNATTDHFRRGSAAARVFRACEALEKRMIQSCGTCADHGCVACSCKQPA